MRNARTSRIPRAGLTLLEVLFATAIMSMVAALVFLILHRSSDHFSNESSSLQLEGRAREILIEVARDLRESHRDTFSTGDPPVPVVDGTAYNDFRFRVNSGYDLKDRSVQYAGTVRYRFRLDDGEFADGLDNNGNGLVDEGYVEKTDRYGTITRIGTDAKQPGITFTPNGRVVVVTLTLERRDLKGTPIRRQASISVDLRNEP
jgi:prepilin-type N-terminal cleavage/methylation domain-containing protein